MSDNQTNSMEKLKIASRNYGRLEMFELRIDRGNDLEGHYTFDA